MNEEKIQVVRILPGAYPEVITIDNNLRSLQKEVGGDIEVLPLDDVPGVIIICNESGKLMGLAKNRTLYHNGTLCDVLVGAILCVSREYDEICGLTQENINKVIDRFKMIEVFL